MMNIIIVMVKTDNKPWLTLIRVFGGACVVSPVIVIDIDID